MTARPPHHPLPTGEATPLRGALSQAVGRLTRRRLPRPLRVPLFRAWAWATGSDLDQVLLPLPDHPTFGAFFTRRLRPGARRFQGGEDELCSPVDGTVQAVGTIREGDTLQAKGVDYRVDDLLAGAGCAEELEGGLALTLYLAPRDYHRIHAPEDLMVTEVRHVSGTRFSVRPSVLARRPVLDRNERVVLTHEGSRGRGYLVLVGALNVGSIRVVGGPPMGAPGLATGAPGLATGTTRLATGTTHLVRPLHFRRGEELARFEMGSTVVGLWPRGAWQARVNDGEPVRAGEVVADASP